MKYEKLSGICEVTLMTM